MVRKLFAGVLVAGLVVIGSVAPASADHLVGFHPEGGCMVGELTGVIPMELSTPDFRFKQFRDGSSRLVCRFRDLPDHVPADDRQDGYWAPTRAVRVPLWSRGACVIDEFDYSDDAWFLVRPNGTGMLVCEWDRPAEPVPS
jgi:hypothetical protein